MIPANVQNYWDAQWWEFFHFGLPSLVVVAIIGIIAKWQEYREDCSVNDDDGETFKNAGKTLGL